jgi:hypothetical protein
MFIYCDKCKYDSGDRDTVKELSIKVLEDGGLVVATDAGWHVECPNGHNEDYIHLD